MPRIFKGPEVSFISKLSTLIVVNKNVKNCFDNTSGVFAMAKDDLNVFNPHSHPSGFYWGHSAHGPSTQSTAFRGLFHNIFSS